MAEEDDIHFSRLEASFVKTKVMPRANSIEMKDTNRHTQAGDAEARDLEFDFGLDRSHYPLDDLQSLQDVFSAVQHEAHAKNTRNFSDQTRIECLDANADSTSSSNACHVKESLAAANTIQLGANWTRHHSPICSR